MSKICSKCGYREGQDKSFLGLFRTRRCNKCINWGKEKKEIENKVEVKSKIEDSERERNRRIREKLKEEKKNEEYGYYTDDEDENENDEEEYNDGHNMGEDEESSYDYDADKFVKILKVIMSTLPFIILVYFMSSIFQEEGITEAVHNLTNSEGVGSAFAKPISFMFNNFFVIFIMFMVVSIWFKFTTWGYTDDSE